MPNYDYLILSPNEFEHLSKDIIQQRDNMILECFTNGKDNGIDMRYSSISKDNQIVVQAKRYKDYNTLFSNLKNEINKVAKLNPQRYILVTSVGLTPNNKDKIKSIFIPYILSTADIIGKDDLDNYMDLYPRLKQTHIKLWLSNSDILNAILHSRVYNQSKFELEKIDNDIKYYVFNDSFFKALQILNKHRYIIISGIPGIGKTTLAHMLVYYLLATGYEEFVYISDMIDDAYELYGEDERKQIFLFDDFLGSCTFENKGKNVDSKIIRFIYRIQSQKNKLLIFTTREYILQQAINQYEKFQINNVQIAKCTIDLSHYTKKIRAQILYNHFVFEDIPIAHIENLCIEENYTPIINHENYNPRILEVLISERIWNNCEANDFARYIKYYFDNPVKIWEYAYNSLDEIAQISMIVLLSTDTPILYKDWIYALKAYLKTCNKEHLFSEHNFKYIIKILENTFINITQNKNGLVIEYQNPSVKDFLYNNVKFENDVIDNIIKSIVFVNQITNLFCDDNDIDAIKLNDSQAQILVDIYTQKQGQFKNSTLIRVYSKNDVINYNKPLFKTFSYESLRNILVNYGHLSTNIEDIVINFIDDISITFFNSMERDAFIIILECINKNKLKKTGKCILHEFLNNLHSIDDILEYAWLEYHFPRDFKKIVKSDYFKDILNNAIIERIDSITLDSDIEDIRTRLALLNDHYPNFDVTEYEQELNEQEELAENERKNDDFEQEYKEDEKNDDSEERIKEIFSSLLK